MYKLALIPPNGCNLYSSLGFDDKSTVFLIIKTFFFFISVTLACGGSSAENITYLELAATTSPPSTNCEYKLCGANANVCRIRFDFEVCLIFVYNTLQFRSNLNP